MLFRSVLRDGFVYSKDLMFFDEEGGLHFAGRGDDVINIRGFKVAPTEVEDVVLRFEKVADCACVPYDDKVFGRCLKLFVAMRDGDCFNVEELSSFLEKKLESYKIPRFIEHIDKIPRTYNGKVDRKKLV